MREFNFKNLEKDIICQDFILKDGKTDALDINENIYSLMNIPSVEIANLKFFVLQKNMCDYLIIINKNEGIEYSIKIQQDIVNNKAQIINIYFHMYISSENSLCSFVNFTNQNLTIFYNNYIPYLLNFLPYTSEEIEWYKNQIEKYITAPKKEIPTQQKLKIVKKERRAYHQNNYMIDGVRYDNLREVGRAFNIAPSTLHSRIQRGMTIEEAVTKPIEKIGRRLEKIRKENN